MDVSDLLKNAPGLLDSIKEAGVPQDKVSGLGEAIGQQLGGDDGFDLTDLLGGLNLDDFLSKVDPAAIAQQVGLPPVIAEKAIALIGPAVAEFVPGGLGALSSLKKLF